MGISGQTIWRQTGNFLRKQNIIRKITYYEPGLSGLLGTSRGPWDLKSLGALRGRTHRSEIAKRSDT